MSLSFVAGSQDVTPELPIPLAGGGEPTTPYLSADGRIEANFVVVRGARVPPVLIISVDALFAGSNLAHYLAGELEATVAPDHVMLLASHTHFAPALDRGKPRLGEVEDVYLRSCAVGIAASVREAMSEAWCVGNLEVGVGVGDHSINRRKRLAVSATRKRLRLGAAVMAPDKNGPRDETITVVSFLDTRGRAVAVLWNYACHPVSFPRPRTMSAHYPGYIREALRVHFGNATLPVIFAQGFSGDTRPNHPSVVSPSNTGLRRLLLGPGFSQFDEQGYVDWCRSLSGQVLKAVLASKSLDDARLSFASIEVPSSDFVRETRSRSLLFQALRIGGALVVAVPCEPVSEHSSWLRAVFPSEAVVPCGCANDVACYMPTMRMVDCEGGYEVEGFCRTFEVEALQPLAPARFRGSLESLFGRVYLASG